MRLQVGGPLRVRFEMNGLMLSGLAVGAVGMAGWAAEAFGLLPGKSRLGDLAKGLTLLGLALYFLGRIVQLVADFRRKR